MTLLQRGVIERLREAGYPALADLARAHWPAGEHIPSGTRELLADVLRADAQADAS